MLGSRRTNADLDRILAAMQSLNSAGKQKFEELKEKLAKARAQISELQKQVRRVLLKQYCLIHSSDDVARLCSCAVPAVAELSAPETPTASFLGLV